MGKWWIRLGLILGVVAAALALRFTLFAPQPVPVRVARVERGAVEETVTNSRAGTVKARRRAKLSPEIGGQVLAIPFREGQTVAAGDLLLELDPRSLAAQMELARRDAEAAVAERQRACLAAERAARELARMRLLAADEIVSTDMLDQFDSAHATAQAACQAATATVERARAAESVARAELAKTRLLAPFAGIVAEVTTEVGEWVTPSPPALPVPPVIDLLDPGSIYISAPMDEVDSARIHPGLPVRVTVDSHRDRSFPGRIDRVAPYVLDVQEQNRTVEIEVTLDDPGLAATLLPGTSADAEVILEVHEGVLRVPTSALIEGNRVLVLDAGRLAERQVEVGLRNWDFTEVRSGLAEGDEVVSSLDKPEIVAGARAEVSRGGEG